MNETRFYYGVKQQSKIAYMFLALGVFGALFAFYLFFFDQSGYIRLFSKVASIFLICVGLGVFFKLIISPKRQSEAAIIISEQGIFGTTTMVAKSAGLIEWIDIKEISVYKGEMVIELNNKEKYQQRMKGFLAKDGYKASKNRIRISIMEVNVTREELFEAIERYNRP